jgi:hypothetical protein
MNRAMASQNDRPLAVDLPRGDEDRPQWIKVGVIAAIGFAVGIAWPRLAGIRLGPTAPGDAPPAASAAPAAPAAPNVPGTSAAGSAPAVLATAPPASSPEPSASAPPTPVGPPHVTVARPAIVSCKTDEGDALKGAAACGGLPGFDAIARPRIQRLKDCSAAEGATGKLSVVMGVDFPNNRINVEIGKSSSVPNLESIGACVKQQFAGVSLGAMDHTHPRYTIAYGATLGPPDAAGAVQSPASTGTAPVAMDAPTVSVVWEVAIVRDSPRTGQVVGRLQRGAKIRVGQGQDNWYRVRYGNGWSSEGWVYRGAIGK